MISGTILHLKPTLLDTSVSIKRTLSTDIKSLLMHTVLDSAVNSVASVELKVCLCSEWCMLVVTPQCDCQVAEQHSSWIQTLLLCGLTEESETEHDLQPTVIHITTTTIIMFIMSCFVKMDETSAESYMEMVMEDYIWSARKVWPWGIKNKNNIISSTLFKERLLTLTQGWALSDFLQRSPTLNCRTSCVF